MKISSAYLYKQLTMKYDIKAYAGLSGTDGYLRPFLYDEKKEIPMKGHVCVAFIREQKEQDRICRIYGGEEVFLVFCQDGELENKGEIAADEAPAVAWVKLQAAETETAEILNELQQIFDECDIWNQKINEIWLTNGGVEKILELTSEFLDNPLFVMGLDFTLVAETGMEQMPERTRLFTEDGINMELMNALIQDPLYQKMARAREIMRFPGYIGEYESWNRNLFVEGQPTHRLVLPAYRHPLSEADLCILETVSKCLEYMLVHEESTNMAGDLEQIFLRLLSDRTADYVQISRQLSAAGWNGNHEYFCLILQITYLNQQQLSTRAIRRYIKQQFPDSISFIYRDEVVTFFNLTRLNLSGDEVAAKLVYFIRDSYLKAGYSRAMEGHMNLRRQYVQARTALDVGSRKKPYLWIHHFGQVVLTYIIEQATRRLPGNMLCHEGLLRLRDQDQKNNTEYMDTLKAYLEQHLSATHAANALFIHRSTFLYRLDRIREILQSDLEDPEEIFYLELSYRLLEQEEEKN